MNGSSITTIDVGVPEEQEADGVPEGFITAAKLSEKYMLDSSSVRRRVKKYNIPFVWRKVKTGGFARSFDEEAFGISFDNTRSNKHYYGYGGTDESKD